MQPFLLGGLRRLLVVHGDGGQGLFVEWPICNTEAESLLAEVKVEAQEVFQCNFLRLNPEKRDLVMNKSLKELGVEDGEILMATLQRPQIAATQRDFALFCHHGGITWGTENSKVPMGMADMQQLTQVETTEGAFAALTDGKVVTWGCAVLGGDSSTVQEELVDIQKIWSTQGAFAAKRADGKIITWGDAKAGCHRVRDRLGEVVEIYSAHVAFAAVVGVHRSVVTWGSPEASECHVQDRLYGVYVVLMLCLQRFWMMEL